MSQQKWIAKTKGFCNGSNIEGNICQNIPFVYLRGGAMKILKAKEIPQWEIRVASKSEIKLE